MSWGYKTFCERMKMTRFLAKSSDETSEIRCCRTCLTAVGLVALRVLHDISTREEYVIAGYIDEFHLKFWKR